METSGSFRPHPFSVSLVLTFGMQEVGEEVFGMCAHASFLIILVFILLIGEVKLFTITEVILDVWF